MNTRRQGGLTLVIALVMLVILSLLVVSATRFGNINLKITGNVQAEAEATAAAQVAVEQTIQTMITTPNMSTIAAQPDKVVSSGAADYHVSVAKPVCVLTKNVSTTELDPSKAADLPCFEGSDTEKLVTASDTLTSAPTACKNQQWDVQATVDDSKSGAKTTILQGVATRVGAEVQCP